MKYNFKSMKKKFYLTQVARMMKTSYRECPFITKNGREIGIGQNEELVASGGKVEGVQAVARDITDLVRTQNELYRSYGVNPQTVKLEIDVEEIRMELNAVIPCGLIINELLSNSLKYAFPDNRTGNIKIR